jgi:hypothetical protein
MRKGFGMGLGDRVKTEGFRAQEGVRFQVSGKAGKIMYEFRIIIRMR